MRALGWIVALLVAACVPSSQVVENPVVVLMRDAHPACSAFAIGRDEMLTAAHCVAGRDGAPVVTEPQWNATAKGSVWASVVWIDTQRDVAALTSSLVFVAPLRLRSPTEGEDVHAIGAAFGWSTERGTLRPGFGRFLDTSLTVWPGWSGSPVLGSDGAAVGVLLNCLGGMRGADKFCLPDGAVMAVLP